MQKYMEIKNSLDCTLHQANLDRLCEWSVTWRRNFNHSRCKILTVSRSKAPVFFNYMLNGNSLEHVTSFKDLGVLVSSDLSWNGHVYKCTTRNDTFCDQIRRPQLPGQVY